MKLKKLGEFLNRTSDKDSSIAAELYNPGFDSNSNEREPTESLEPGRHDLAAKVRQDLREWATSASESNVYAYASDRTFLEQASEDNRVRFELTSKNNRTLGQLIVPSPRGVAIKNPSEAAGPGRIVSQGMLSGWKPAVVSSNYKSTAYPELPPDSSPLDQAVQASLEGNLHAPGRAYLSEPGSEMEDGTIRDGLYSVQNGGFGKFDPNRKRMEVDDLKRAVEATLENARGIVSDEGRAGGVAGDNINNILKSLANFAAPTIAPLQGIYDVRISKVQAIKDKFGEVEGQDEIARVREDFNIGDLLARGGGTTYGVLNTPSQVFDGPPNGMIMTAFAGMLVLNGLIEVYGRFIHLLLTSNTKEPAAYSQLLPASVKRVANELGLNYNSTLNENDDKKNSYLTFFVNQFKDLNSIIYYAKKGLDIFYGYKNTRGEFRIPIAGVKIASLLDYKSVFESPGFYANVTRIVLRDAQIVTQFTQQNADSSSGTGIPNAVNSLAALAENLLTSPSFKLVVNFAKLGVLDESDNTVHNFLPVKSISAPENLIRKANTPQEVNNALQTVFNNMGTVQKFDDETIKSVQSNRLGISHLQFNNLKFSPLSNRYYASLLQAGSGNKYSTKDDTFYTLKYGKIAGNGRFTPEQVDEIEKIIDTDYVPFSIQDVRTNEVLSLPSFIESINDSFNVSYESTHGYGRTDPIHSYSKTERIINLNFVIVAFSIEDHQNVYNIVNKLTSMCYPQRSAGTRRKSNNVEFTQPFSQIPTASPLIRIRLGDLLRNNRTADTFKWMFGDDAALQEQASTEFKEDQEKNSILAKWRSYRLNVGDRIRLNKIPFVRIFKNSDGVFDIEKPLGIVPPAKNYIYEFTISDKRTIASANDLAPIFEDEIVNLLNPETNETQLYTKEAFNFFFIENSEKQIYKLKCEGKTYFGLRRDAAQLAQYFQPPSTNNNFYSANNNAVVRSFRSTAGRGLAGFIKDLQLDYSGFNWGIDSKFRAPMGVKVTMSFAPIHDAPLGLDHKGKMISPTHPVGFEYEGFE